MGHPWTRIGVCICPHCARAVGAYASKTPGKVYVTRHGQKRPTATRPYTEHCPGSHQLVTPLGVR